MPDVRTPMPTTSSPFWKRIFAADYPMVALNDAMHVGDKARRKLALDVACEPKMVAEAFERTIAALCPYDVQEPFRTRTLEVPVGPTANPGALRAAKDVALRLRPAGQLTPVDASGVVGAGNGDLDLVFLEREPALTRTPKALREAEFVQPDLHVKADLLLAAPDGTIGIGEVRVKQGGDLFASLIKALTGLALVATPAQIRRVFANYVTPQFGLPPGPAPKLDVILIDVPRSSPSVLLTQLDVLARGFVPELLAQPAIAAVIRQVVCLRAAIAGESLQLTGRWLERPAL